jgi:branched-chain amino acid transport system substrate-binding protein
LDYRHCSEANVAHSILDPEVFMNKIQTLIASVVLAVGVAQAGETLVTIGHVAPLTGNIAHLGKDNENGARLAIEDYNAKGLTIGGHKVRFELMGEDDQADPRTGNIVAQRLADAGVKGVVGHLNSGTTIPASRVYYQAGIPMVSPSATNPALTHQGFENVFRTMSNDIQQGAVLGKFAIKLGHKAAIIDDRTAYGQGLADEVAKTVETAGGQVVTREFTSNQATDFLAILTKIKAKEPDVVFFGGMDAQAGPMLKQIKQLGLKSKFLTGDGGCSPTLVRLAGDAISGQVYCSQAGLPLEQLADKTFNERYQKRFHAKVQIYAPYAYDAVAAIIEAMKMADSVEPDQYLPALKKVDFMGVTGRVAFDENGDTKYGTVTLYRFQDGKLVALPH